VASIQKFKTQHKDDRGAQKIVKRANKYVGGSPQDVDDLDDEEESSSSDQESSPLPNSPELSNKRHNVRSPQKVIGKPPTKKRFSSSPSSSSRSSFLSKSPFSSFSTINLPPTLESEPTTVTETSLFPYSVKYNGDLYLFYLKQPNMEFSFKCSEWAVVVTVTISPPSAPQLVELFPDHAVKIEKRVGRFSIKLEEPVFWQMPSRIDGPHSFTGIRVKVNDSGVQSVDC